LHFRGTRNSAAGLLLIRPSDKRGSFLFQLGDQTIEVALHSVPAFVTQFSPTDAVCFGEVRTKDRLRKFIAES
jgi:hypothetical protein